MSELRKANTDLPYFITMTVTGWIDVFTHEVYNEEIVKNLKYCINNKGLELYAYVIMPSHIHMIARSNEGMLNNIMRDFKSFTAKRILKMISGEIWDSRRDWLLKIFEFDAVKYKQNFRYLFWQKTNYPIEVEDPLIFDQKVEYIHYNPVKAGFVKEPEFWKYSSANPDSPIKIYQD